MFKLFLPSVSTYFACFNKSQQLFPIFPGKHKEMREFNAVLTKFIHYTQVN